MEEKFTSVHIGLIASGLTLVFLILVFLILG